jgi:hypothetical protein
MDDVVVAPLRRARLRGAHTLLLLTILFIQINWLCWYYLDVQIDAPKLLAETTTGGIVGLMCGLFPVSNKRYLNRTFRRLLNSAASFRSSATSVSVIAVVAILVNRTEIR